MTALVRGFPFLRRPAFWAFAALLAVEFLLFDGVGAKPHTRIYPRWNDQVQYLSEAYTGWEHARACGLASGLWHTLVNPTAQGTLHDFWAVLVFAVAGPSRSAALAVNMLAFLVWQAALFLAVRRAFGSHALAWAGAGLLLALASPWSGGAGSAIDFRLDWLATASLGTTLAVALSTEGFRRRGWSAVFGAAVGATLLTRFLTGAYFAMIFAALFAWTLAGPERARRTGNLLLAAAVALAVSGPLMWISRADIFNYYWSGHFVGPESAIRNQNMGIARSIAWIADVLRRDHLGTPWLWLAGGATLLLGAGAAIRPKSKGGTASASRPGHSAAVLGAVFLLAPALVLTLHAQKSSVVLDALLPGAVILVLALWERLADRAGPAAAWAVAGLSLALGGGFFVQRMCAAPFPAETAAGARTVAAVADSIIDRSRAAGLATPRVGIDQITDCLDGQVLRVICYERKHVWVNLDMTLPVSIAEAPEAEIVTRLARSDFVFLTVDGPVGTWPFDRQMRRLLPKTKAWCDAHLRFTGQFDISGQRLALYQRPEIPIPPR